ncbi:hypothetical protein pb186bvf_003811 [Paramecium bursaria]
MHGKIVYDYGYLKVPKCEVCGTIINKLSKVYKNQFTCHICDRIQKLPNWYAEKPIKDEDFIIQTVNQQPHDQRVLFLLDITSKALYHMIVPLINLAFDKYDEVGIIACTPYPTSFEFSEKGNIKLITGDIKINFYKREDRKQIQQILKQLNHLSDYSQCLVKNANPIEIIYEMIIERIDTLKSVKIIQFQWIYDFSPSFQLCTILGFRNHYQLYIIDESQKVGNYYDDLLNSLNGECKVYLPNQLEEFYSEVEDFVLNRQFMWDAQLKVRLSKGWRHKLNGFDDYAVYNLFNLDERMKFDLQIIKDDPKASDPKINLD